MPDQYPPEMRYLAAQQTPNTDTLTNWSATHEATPKWVRAREARGTWRVWGSGLPRARSLIAYGHAQVGSGTQGVARDTWHTAPGAGASWYACPNIPAATSPNHIRAPAACIAVRTTRTAALVHASCSEAAPGG